MLLKITFYALLFFIIPTTLFAQIQPRIRVKDPLPIGIVEIFYSQKLQESRRLNIYLPLGYHKDSIQKYPVIYLLDGSMDEDFIHIAGLVQFGSFSWINMLPESIVVGIANTNRDRDFTFPTELEELQKQFPTIGGSQSFIDYIEKEVQPFMKSSYNISDKKTLIGQSLGGLLATEILFKKPDLFDNYIIISPSLWWDNESLLKETPKSYSSPKSIYIGVGKKEEAIMQREAKQLYQKLKQAQKKDTKLFFHLFKKQNHGDILHLAVYDAFLKLFSK